MRIIKPPTPLADVETNGSVFLAGSIEMGGAQDWQSIVAEQLHDLEGVILNPRRDQWDASWEQSLGSPLFRGQVDWELDAQGGATWIAMYFDPQTRAPITLLELGLFAASGKLIVCCPEGYWRKGNVDIVCDRYGIPTVGTIDQLAEEIRLRLDSSGENRS